MGLRSPIGSLRSPEAPLRNVFRGCRASQTVGKRDDRVVNAQAEPVAEKSPAARSAAARALSRDLRVLGVLGKCDILHWPSVCNLDNILSGRVRKQTLHTKE